MIFRWFKKRAAKKARKQAQRKQRIENVGKRKAKNHAKVKNIPF